MDQQIAYRFVSHDIPALETLSDAEGFRLKSKLIKGEKLTREEKDRVFEMTHDSSGIYKLYGWLFDFREYLNRYYVKFNYGHIQQYYALDKTSIRAELTQIAEIVEAEKRTM